MANETMEQGVRRLLGVFAHPDGETFCAGGTFAKYTAADAEAMFVSFTKGDAGQIRDAGTATRKTLGGVRERELRGACRAIGVQTVDCLDHKDGGLADADPDELARKIVRLIRTFRPDVVFTFGAEGAYGHPDHVAISVATTETCKIAGDPQVSESDSRGTCTTRAGQALPQPFPAQPDVVDRAPFNLAQWTRHSVPRVSRLCSKTDPVRQRVGDHGLQQRPRQSRMVPAGVLHHRTGRTGHESVPDPVGASRSVPRRRRWIAAEGGGSRTCRICRRNGAGMRQTA